MTTDIRHIEERFVCMQPSCCEPYLSPHYWNEFTLGCRNIAITPLRCCSARHPHPAHVAMDTDSFNIGQGLSVNVCKCQSVAQEAAEEKTIKILEEMVRKSYGLI